ncbi:DNA helicase RecQ [Amnimonas aquatica]|nr:DNA helicase RecQ [Amnimonas aquatica]
MMLDGWETVPAVDGSRQGGTDKGVAALRAQLAGMAPELRAREALRHVWGYDDFRGRQADVVETVASGRDALVLMPTGGGKSLCYQVPALMRRGTAVVVSPLISLMQDQVATLLQLGVRAAYLSSSLEAHEARAIESQLLDGRLDLIYMAPERLVTPRALDLLARVDISLFAIDEAHCVSQWGHDFRADYLGLSVLAEQFPQVPRLALTATADLRTRADIVRLLKLEAAEVFISSFDRPNLFYRMLPRLNALEQLTDFIKREHAGDAGIVYCLSRAKTEKVAEALRARGFPALAYHAGLPAAEREANQTRFLREEGVIVVATIAFGMGIDKSNVRFVAHLDLPKSVEAYYQETGRAGRDGLPSTVCLFYGLQDVIKHQQMLSQSEGSEEHKRHERRRIDAMLQLCETTDCRRQLLLRYFDEHMAQPCGYCDTCAEPVATWDATEPARLALSAVYRTGQRYGVEYVVEVLTGKRSERVGDNRHDQLALFGQGSDTSLKTWRSIFRQLLAKGLLLVDPDGYGTLRLSPDCRALLKGEVALTLRRDRDTLTAQRSARGGSRAAASVASADQPLWLALRAKRRELAEAQGVPPYVIFHDSTLLAMIEHMPLSLREMRQIGGIGDSKLERYGDDFLAVIRDHVDGASGAGA